MDGTVVNVALPAIQRSFNAATSDAQWVMESYALLLSALLLVGGALGDRYGRRRIFIIGVVVFAVSSAACAFSGSALQLIITRAIQGIGAALLIPGSLALISAAYPPTERGAAIGSWSAFSAITAAIGPVIGGFIVEHYSWKWAFLLNLPLSAALLLICIVKLPADLDNTRGGAVDIGGALAATVALAGVVFALIEGPVKGWASGLVIGSAGLGFVGAVLFVAIEHRTKAPMLPLTLFRERNFAGANVLTLLLYAALGGSLFFLPLDLIQVQGYGATAAGAAFLPFIAIMFSLSRWAGGLVDRFGSKHTLMVGPAIASVGFALFAVPGISPHYWMTFFPAIGVLGVGMSITVAPLTTTVMNSVGVELAGTASGVNNAVSRAGGLFAIAIFGIVLLWVFNARLQSGLAALHLNTALTSPILAQRQKLAGIVMPMETPAQIAVAIKQVIGRSFVAGFRVVMLLSAALALLAAICAWLFIDGKSSRARH